jgi:hypothetical protein
MTPVPAVPPLPASNTNPAGSGGLIVRVTGSTRPARTTVVSGAIGLPTVAVSGGNTGFAARAGPATATDSPTAAMLTDVTIATILAGIRTKWLLVVVTTVSYVWG